MTGKGLWRATQFVWTWHELVYVWEFLHGQQQTTAIHIALCFSKNPPHICDSLCYLLEMHDKFT